MKTYNKYESLISNAWFSERQLISFRKAVNGSSKMDGDLKSDLVQHFNRVGEERGIKLDQSQQVKGYLWLKENCYKKNGELRRTPVLQGEFELQILDNFSHFTCSGLYQASDNNYSNYVPIYRMHSTDGAWFEYACNMGQIEVLAIGQGKRTTGCKVWPGFESMRGIKKPLRLINGGAA